MSPKKYFAESLELFQPRNLVFSTALTVTKLQFCVFVMQFGLLLMTIYDYDCLKTFCLFFKEEGERCFNLVYSYDLQDKVRNGKFQLKKSAYGFHKTSEEGTSTLLSKLFFPLLSPNSIGRS